MDTLLKIIIERRAIRRRNTTYVIKALANTERSIFQLNRKNLLYIIEIIKLPRVFMFENTPLIPSPTLSHEIITENLPVYSIQVITLSKCCNSSVSISTKDDFKKLDKRNTDSLLMSVIYICNSCGNPCEIYDKYIDYSILPKKSLLKRLIWKIKSIFQRK